MVQRPEQAGRQEWFDAEARAEWQRVVPGLERLDLLKPEDRAMLRILHHLVALCRRGRAYADGLTMTNPDSSHTSAHPCV